MYERMDVSCNLHFIDWKRAALYLEMLSVLATLVTVFE